MGTRTNDATVNIRLNADIITCQLCMELFKSPRLLPCQHTYCQTCVEKLVHTYCLNKVGPKSDRYWFPCPECRRECRWKGLKNIKKTDRDNKEWLKAFPENRLIKTLIESEIRTDISKKRRRKRTSKAKQSEGKLNETKDDTGLVISMDILRQVYFHLDRLHISLRAINCFVKESLKADFNDEMMSYFIPGLVYNLIRLIYAKNPLCCQPHDVELPDIDTFNQKIDSVTSEMKLKDSAILGRFRQYFTIPYHPNKKELDWLKCYLVSTIIILVAVIGFLCLCIHQGYTRMDMYEMSGGIVLGLFFLVFCVRLVLKNPKIQLM